MGEKGKGLYLSRGGREFGTEGPPFSQSSLFPDWFQAAGRTEWGKPGFSQSFFKSLYFTCVISQLCNADDFRVTGTILSLLGCLMTTHAAPRPPCVDAQQV